MILRIRDFTPNKSECVYLFRMGMAPPGLSPLFHDSKCYCLVVSNHVKKYASQNGIISPGPQGSGGTYKYLKPPPRSQVNLANGLF